MLRYHLDMLDFLRENSSFLFFTAWAVAVIYLFYMTWFRPSKFLKDSVRAVKDWWPFADDFRFMYGSSFWLWTSRIVSAIFAIVLLYATYGIIFKGFRLVP